jgi:hypothetical protein
MQPVVTAQGLCELRCEQCDGVMIFEQGVNFTEA